MGVSVTGLLVCAAVALVGWLLGSTSIVGLIASLAFGSTSVLTLSALGGSSPLMYVVFALGLLALAFVHKDFPPGLSAAFARDWVPWAVCGTVMYAVAGAVILPRLFAGATSAFVTGRITGVVEVALAPNAGNVTQTGYFALGALTCLGLMALLHRERALVSVRRGFLLWASINALGGAIDLAAKTAGAGDVFLFLRTATFAYLTGAEQAGFARVNGLFSEASGFAGAALPSLAFTFTYWKHGGSRFALVLAAALLVLLLLSTSSTAYAGLAILTLPTLVSMARSVARGRIGGHDLLLVAAFLAMAAFITFILVYDQNLFTPVQDLFQTTVLDKAQSESGRERSYWNERSLASLADTWGLGIGFGSGRASNWLVAVASQLGVIGLLLQLSLLLPFLRRPSEPAASSPARDTYALHNALRACALSSLIAGVIAGGSADPGMLFFVALAGVFACQGILEPAERPASFPRTTWSSAGAG